MKIEDVQVSETDTNISLSKLLGQKIVDIQGYISYEFGDPSFKMSKVILENGQHLWCEGEHDFPYLTEGATPVKNFDDETLRSLEPEEEDD